MRSLVVFESMFGNTEVIARSIADGLSSLMDVEVVEVGRAPSVLDQQVDLLVVGGPTHALGMSRPGTRQSAEQQAKSPIVSQRFGIREWLASLQSRDANVSVATFDTRIKIPPMPGSAARAAERRLRRLGFRVVTPAESFFVDGTSGPLLDGEIERARSWGEMLAATAQGNLVELKIPDPGLSTRWASSRE